jgi:phosphoribosylformylglycinamidine synthase
MLDLLTGCGGNAPGIPDVSVLKTVRDLVNSGAVVSATDISKGGFIAALSGFAPLCEIKISGNAFDELFSESYGRFLIAYDDSEKLKGVNIRTLGVVGGDSLLIHTDDSDIEIKKEELSSWLSSTTRLMRF